MSQVVTEAAYDRLLRLPEVLHRTSLSRSTVYNLIKGRRFPPGVQIAPRRRGWLASEIDRFLREGQG